jgi:hypothetical protein
MICSFSISACSESNRTSEICILSEYQVQDPLRISGACIFVEPIDRFVTRPSKVQEKCWQHIRGILPSLALSAKPLSHELHPSSKPGAVAAAGLLCLNHSRHRKNHNMIQKGIGILSALSCETRSHEGTAWPNASQGMLIGTTLTRIRDRHWLKFRN